jgi:glycosyltransferase involved in cell wall biosynthesis
VAEPFVIYTCSRTEMCHTQSTHLVCSGAIDGFYMRVSAVIPTYNRRRYIERAIDSVLAQTTPVDEIIVVDDGSSDGTPDLVESRYGARVRVVRQANTGVAGARHRGIMEARGEWIAFLDSDDVWTPERTGELLKAVCQVPPDVAWIFGDLRLVTDEGDGLSFFEEHGVTIETSPQVLQDSLSIQYPFQFPMLQASFIRRVVLLELDCFSEGLRSDDDLLAGFQVACRYKFAAIPSVVGRYFRTSDLAASSVVVNGNFGRDYYRSRMLAFSRVIYTTRKLRPWNARYASEARGLCQFLGRRGHSVRKLALQQFRFGAVSAKSVAFLLAALLGRRGLVAWDNIAAVCRKLSMPAKKALKERGFQAYLQSISKNAN